MKKHMQVISLFENNIISRKKIENEAFHINTNDDRAKMLLNVLISSVKAQTKYTLKPDKIIFKKDVIGNIEIWFK
ncbi:MAG: hypothetical protein M3Q58_01665 [Bacteroidota bacterium]|nr:hypothetical protein [Bacteroidota bacterium]